MPIDADELRQGGDESQRDAYRPTPQSEGRHAHLDRRISPYGPDSDGRHLMCTLRAVKKLRKLIKFITLLGIAIGAATFVKRRPRGPKLPSPATTPATFPDVPTRPADAS